MILENYNQEVVEIVDLQESPEFIGDASEFAELSVSAFAEMHNLTIALARVEHKCLVESNQELLEEGVKEFFAKAGKAIAEYFRRFVAWLGSLVTKLKDVFIKREDWLKRNASAISAVTEEQLKGTKVKLGKNMLGTDFGSAASAAVGAANTIIGGVKAVKNAEDQRSFLEKAKDALKKPLKTRDEKKSTAAEIHASMIGDAEEVELSKSLVGQLMAVAHSTFKAADQIKGAKTAAEGAMKVAEGMARIEGGSKEDTNAQIAALRDVGHIIQATIAGHASAIGAANGMAMPALVKVASLAGKKKEEAAPAAAAEAKPEAKQEEVSVLAAFM